MREGALVSGRVQPAITSANNETAMNRAVFLWINATSIEQARPFFAELEAGVVGNLEVDKRKVRCVNFYEYQVLLNLPLSTYFYQNLHLSIPVVFVKSMYGDKILNSGFSATKKSRHS